LQWSDYEYYNEYALKYIETCIATCLDSNYKEILLLATVGTSYIGSSVEIFQADYGRTNTETTYFTQLKAARSDLAVNGIYGVYDSNDTAYIVYSGLIVGG
jgi:hypothetical protein